MELVFLGTSAGVPSKERNVSSIALKLLEEQNSIWLFDCGEATQHQILHTSIKPRKINNIFITHMHGDHIFGLPGLLSSRSFQGGDDLLTIHGPPGIKEFVETNLRASGTHLTYPLSIQEVEKGQSISKGSFTVEVEKLDHGIPCFGYRVKEADKPGELLVAKLMERGIMPGPIYKKIKENDSVETHDGQLLKREDFIGKKKKGRVVTIFGDTRLPEKFQEFAKNSDVLVHEATFEHSKEETAKQYFHSTTTQAARLAKQSNSRKLIITHISSRYQAEDDNWLLEEARKIFPDTEIATDLSHIKIEAL
ncbi:ribonuclease Z [Virgibacillus xinjiangensis]|uniref:Ribonuclease Z n=1 Tax=Virgibacillus xinjiangensis TaxID=393090 RepID=A0ABV7CRG7_9BACI